MAAAHDEVDECLISLIKDYKRHMTNVVHTALPGPNCFGLTLVAREALDETLFVFRDVYLLDEGLAAVIRSVAGAKLYAIWATPKKRRNSASDAEAIYLGAYPHWQMGVSQRQALKMRQELEKFRVQKLLETS